MEIFSRRGTNGLMLMPAEAESALRGWIENMAHFAKVVGAKGESVLARSQDLRRVTADATPVVRLSFEGERLDVAVGTVSCEGADFGPPTDTAGESLARMDGEPVLLVRSAETQLPVFQEILAVLLHEDVESVAAFHWRVMTLSESLSVLTALKAMGDRIRLEWPSGSKVNVSELDDAAVDFSDFKTERNWFAVRGSFKLDSGRMMDIIAMLKALDSSLNGFVRLSDGDYLKLSKSLQRRLEALKAAGVIHKDALEVTPAAVPMLAKAFDDETGELPKALKESASRMATIFARTMAVPKNLKAKLRPYQKDGYAWLARHAECGFGSCLADDMGLGKTLQVIALLLSRSADGPSLVLPNFKDSAKLEVLSELLSDLKSAGHRALVFSQFTDYLAIVRRLLDEKGWSCCYLDGTTPIAERARAVSAFQAGEGDFFLISLKAGGTGLNLTSANYVVLLDPWWNPAVENQAADRVHRIGQRNPVTVYRLIAAKTVEERVLELHQEKLKIAEDVLACTSKSKLTPEMLMRLFA